MKAIRPLERADLTPVSKLYASVMRSGGHEPGPGLPERFARTLLDHPWADPEIPSLVYEDDRHGIAGFLGSYVRRMSLDGSPVRLACSGHLVADPSAGTPGIGALLLRRYLAGPQEVTITDGATDEVRAMWERLGGATGGITCLGWTRVLKPARLVAELGARRLGRRRAHPATGGVSLQGGTDELTPERLAELARRMRVRMRPAYDAEFLDWLFVEMEAVQARGALARRVVTDDGGREQGWYVAYLPRGGIGQAIAIGSVGPDFGPVVDRLFADALAAGSSAVQGRAESGVLPALIDRRCIFRRADWALVHYADDAVAAAAAREQAFVTRLDGEWWMDHHLPRRALTR